MFFKYKTDKVLFDKVDYLKLPLVA